MKYFYSSLQKKDEIMIIFRLSVTINWDVKFITRSKRKGNQNFKNYARVFTLAIASNRPRELFL